MENKKAVLITIVVLTIVFLPLTIIGLIFRDNKNYLEENPSHEFNYKGYLWFYDKDNKFLSKYECMTEICDYVTPTIDDDTYEINYYKSNKKEKITNIDDKYTFLVDGAVIYLYNIDSGKTLQTYKEIKTYNTKDLYIVKNNDDVWGVLNISENLGLELPFEYDFIGLKNDLLGNGMLNKSKYIVLKDSKWFLVDNNNSAVSGYIEDPIIDYTDDYIISKGNNKIRVYGYENNEYLPGYEIKEYEIIDKYLIFITNYEVLVYDNLNREALKNISISETDNVSIKQENNKINISVNNNVVDSIEIR